MRTTAMDSSRRGLWLALAGLLAVPMLGFALALVSMDDDQPEHRSEESNRMKGRSEAAALGPSSRARREPPEAPSLAVRATPPASPPELEPGGERLRAHAPEEIADAGVDLTESEALIAEARRLDRTDPRRSRELLREVLRHDPDNVVALERLSAKLLLDEDQQEAKRLAERCRGLTDNRVCEQTANLAADDDENVEKLGVAAETCLARDPKHVNCLSWMVGYHLAKGRTTDAAIYAGRLTQTAPQAPETLTARGRIKALGGDYAEARQLFEWACRHNDPHACLRLDILRSEGW